MEQEDPLGGGGGGVQLVADLWLREEGAGWQRFRKVAGQNWREVSCHLEREGGLPCWCMLGRNRGKRKGNKARHGGGSTLY
jgi:hypothetical protein